MPRGDIRFKEFTDQEISIDRPYQNDIIYRVHRHLKGL